MKIPAYYKYVLTQYQNYNYRPMDQASNERKEMIWCNRSIRIDGKTLFIDSLYKKGIKCIDDITKTDGTMISISEIRARYPGVRIDFLTYDALLRGIPKLWKQRLAKIPSKEASENAKNDTPILCVESYEHSIIDVRSKHFYEVGLNSRTPKAVLRWEDLGYYGMDWEENI